MVQTLRPKNEQPISILSPNMSEKNLINTPSELENSIDYAQLKLPEQRVTLHNITWEGYLQILDALPQSRGTRLIYDEGTLEISMPFEPHESSVRLIERFILILIIEMGLKIKTMGSTTFNFPKLRKGVEPDSCYYIQNQPLVAGRKVDVNSGDPPPDLVVEVDITHSDINKPKFYARLGVPEFWRYNGKILQIYQLQNGTYVEVENSPIFPWVEKEHLYHFLAECYQDEAEAEINFRAWVKEQVAQNLQQFSM